MAQQAYIQASVAANINAIRDQALGGNRYGYYGGNGGGYAGGGAYASSGGSVGSYGGTSGGQTYGGTYNSGRPSYASPSYSSTGGSTYSSSRPAYSGGSSYSGSRPNYASSGGAVAGGHQTGYAHVSSPGLNSRFGDEPIVTHSQGAPGFVGVSSFSSSSDINGHQHRESGTSVNNNGKVTTYYNRAP